MVEQLLRTQEEVVAEQVQSEQVPLIVIHQEELVEQELNLILMEIIIIGQVVEVALLIHRKMVDLVALVVEAVEALILDLREQVLEPVEVAQLIQEVQEL